MPSQHIHIKETETDVGRHRFMPVDNAIDLWSVLDGDEVELSEEFISAPGDDVETLGMSPLASNISASANQTTVVH
jgi:hypothetical protein